MPRTKPAPSKRPAGNPDRDLPDTPDELSVWEGTEVRMMMRLRHEAVVSFLGAGTSRQW